VADLPLFIDNLPLDVRPKQIAEELWRTVGLLVKPSKIYIRKIHSAQGYADAFIVIHDKDFIEFLNRNWAGKTDGANGGPIVFAPRRRPKSPRAAALSDFLGAIPAEQQTEQVGEDVELNRHGIRKLA
jgi:hypothetical protein